MAKKYYAVKVGRVPGIYMSWSECQQQTAGFSNATFKSFSTKEEADAFMGGASSQKSIVKNASAEQNGDFSAKGLSLPEVYAFTDGSYNVATRVFGYGGFLHVNGQDIELSGHFDDKEEAESRNVSGEVHGAVAAMEKAVELGVKEMTLFYDYEGVEKWPTGMWKTNKKISKFYKRRYEELSKSLLVHFCHVKAHTGIPGNELADKIAKKEVGIL